MGYQKRRRMGTVKDNISSDDSESEFLGGISDRSFSPRINMYEDTGSNVSTATFELPGLKREDISISLLHDKLTIAGESLGQRPRVGGEYTTRELPYGKFSRALSIPLGLRPENFKARMENGLLILTFPKDPPMQEPHYIPIE